MTGNVSHGDGGSRRVGSEGTALLTSPCWDTLREDGENPRGAGCSGLLSSAVGCMDAHPSWAETGDALTGELGCSEWPRCSSGTAWSPRPAPCPPPATHTGRAMASIAGGRKSQAGTWGDPAPILGGGGQGVVARQSRLHGQLKELQIVRPCD